MFGPKKWAWVSRLPSNPEPPFLDSSMGLMTTYYHSYHNPLKQAPYILRGLGLLKLVAIGCANLTAWCSGPRGCALTRDVLLLDAVWLCVGVPARSTVHRDGDEVRVEDG
ncbi:unnamed protein product [Prunus armeniaca]